MERGGQHSLLLREPWTAVDRHGGFLLSIKLKKKNQTNKKQKRNPFQTTEYCAQICDSYQEPP